jgi:hypothetical protein
VQFKLLHRVTPEAFSVNNPRIYPGVMMPSSLTGRRQASPLLRSSGMRVTPGAQYSDKNFNNYKYSQKLKES